MSETVQSGKSRGPNGFAHGHIGTATDFRAYEDRHYFGTIKTLSGLEITLAIVSDGVGGGNLGQRAAQLTVDTIVSECELSKLKDIPDLLGTAIGKANRKIYSEAQKYSDRGGMSATVAIAAIHKKQLYVVNVGDSRVYLFREKELIQLTVDHTWANEQVRSGKKSEEDVLNHPKADHLVRSVGSEPTVRVDQGLYLKDGIESGEEAYANQGLLLGPNDLVLVCSDGLIKTRKDGLGHFVEDDEIVRAINSGTPEQAVKTMIDLAIGRNVDDNVTAVVVEMPGREPTFTLPKNALIIGLLSLGLVVTLLAILFRPEPDTIIVYPDTPTPLPPAPEGYAYITRVDMVDTRNNITIGGIVDAVNNGDIVPFQNGSILRVENGLVIFNTPGNFEVRVYGSLGKPTVIELYQAANLDENQPETILRLKEGAIGVIAGNNVRQGNTFVVETLAGHAVVTGTIMGDRFLPHSNTFDVDCFEGHCMLIVGSNSQGFDEGNHARTDMRGNIDISDQLDKELARVLELEDYLGVTPTPSPTPSMTPTPSECFNNLSTPIPCKSP